MMIKIMMMSVVVVIKLAKVLYKHISSIITWP
jgi:hypothetical protein